MAYALKHQSDARIQPRVILAVDDDTAIRRLISQVLSKKFLVLSASDGKEATRMLVNRKVDLVLTDLRMPEMGGLELARHVHDHYPEVPVAFVSSWLDDVPAPPPDTSGSLRLAKPFMIEDLVLVVERAMAALEPEATRPRDTMLEAARLEASRLETPPAVVTAEAPPLPPAAPAPARAWQALLESGGSRPEGTSPVTRSLDPPAAPPSVLAPQEESPRAWQALLESSRPTDFRAPGWRPETAPREAAAPAGAVDPAPPRRLAPASAVGLDARHQIHSHVNQASLVWECRKKMAGGKPLMLPGENSPFESLLGPDDEVEVSDVDASMLHRGDFAYCQDGDRLAFMRVTDTRVLPDGSLALSVERTGGGQVQLVESRIIGRVTAVVRKGIRIPVGTLSICTKVAGWLQALGSWSGRRSA